MVTCRICAAFVVFCLVLPDASSVLADPGACHRARVSYRSAVDEMKKAWTAYVECLRLERGRDACAVAFVDIETAQREIQDAVDSIRSDCPDED